MNILTETQHVNPLTSEIQRLVDAILQKCSMPHASPRHILMPRHVMTEKRVEALWKF